MVPSCIVYRRKEGYTLDYLMRLLKKSPSDVSITMILGEYSLPLDLNLDTKGATFKLLSYELENAK